MKRDYKVQSSSTRKNLKDQIAQKLQIGDPQAYTLFCLAVVLKYNLHTLKVTWYM